MFKRFFEILYRSIYDLTWLKLQKRSAKRAWGYFAVFVLLVTVLWAVPASVRLPGEASKIKEQVIKNIPEFQASFKGGKLQVEGLQQPYVVKDNNFVFVVDTVSTNTPELSSYLSDEFDSGVLVTRDAIETYDNGGGGQTRTQNLKNIPDTQFNQETIIGLANKFLSPWFIALLILFMIIGVYIGSFVAKLVSILVVTVIVKIVSAIGKRGWTFGELFTTALFAVTLPSFIRLVFNWLGIYFPFIHSLALLAFLLAVVFTKDEAEAIVPASDKPEDKPEIKT